jgi:hypothetical protein
MSYRRGRKTVINMRRQEIKESKGKMMNELGKYQAYLTQ